MTNETDEVDPSHLDLPDGWKNAYDATKKIAIAWEDGWDEAISYLLEILPINLGPTTSIPLHQLRDDLEPGDLLFTNGALFIVEQIIKRKDQAYVREIYQKQATEE